MIPTRTVRITDERLGQFHQYWTSLEGENPSGSIKDRMVEPELYLQKENSAAVAEISAGSTALSISYYALKYKVRCHLFVPSDLDALIKKQLKNRGAHVIECDPAHAYETYHEFLIKAGPKVWPFGQMARKDLALHYKMWSEKHLEPLLPPIDYVVGTVGTGHSLAGVSNGLKPAEGSVSVEPEAGLAIKGIRNVTLQNFGPDDPWRPSLFTSRQEARLTGRFDSSHLETDQGPIYVSDSFQLSLEGILKLSEHWTEPKNIFIVGSHCRRMNVVKNS